MTAMSTLPIACATGGTSSGIVWRKSCRSPVFFSQRIGLVIPPAPVSLNLVITDGTVLKASPEMKYQSLGAGQPTVIVSLISGYLYTANQTTQSFLQAIDGQKTFGAIVSELVEQYDVSAEKLSADMRALAEKLVGEKLLTIVAEATPHA